MVVIFGGHMANSNKKTKPKPNNVADLSETQVLEIIENQPEKVRESITKILVSEKMSYEGPIPPPSLLKEFDSVIPNGADRIMTMAEKQLEHRIDLESKVVSANNRDSFLGVIFAGSLGLIAVVGGIYLILKDKNIQGFVLMLGTIGTLVSVYIRSTKKDEQDLNNKK